MLKVNRRTKAHTQREFKKKEGGNLVFFLNNNLHTLGSCCCCRCNKNDHFN